MVDDTLYQSEREHMVVRQIARRGIKDERVLEAMRQVPRHCFVTPDYHHLAYSDGPLPIGSGQTISQPYIVALMSELLGLSGDEQVLEVGTGSGYQAAVLAHLARQVHSIERHKDLAQQAICILEDLGLDNVQVHVGDGSQGLPELAPYDAIIVTAAAPNVPQPLLDQLGSEGSLVLPVGSLGAQFLERWTKQGDNYKREDVIPVAFVPLIGKHGWSK
jgi:protein-L-isoaspartate(D-aspartate) O-methyltransferase